MKKLAEDISSSTVLKSGKFAWSIVGIEEGCILEVIITKYI